MNIYVSYGYRDDAGKTVINAYERPFIKFDARKLFAEKKP